MQELNTSSVVGGFRISEIIDFVEAELYRWQCNRYMHITRALDATQKGVVNLQSIFSKPVQEQPVPVAVVSVYFHFDTQKSVLTYQFEQENVLHTVGGQSLADGKFEGWIDRIIKDKLKVREMHDLATVFESTRLVPPSLSEGFPGVPAARPESEGPDKTDEAEEDQDTGYEEIEKFEKLPLSTLLVNIFDAADEEDEFELTHKEVSDLLYATPLGLADWDIKLLLTRATELATGRIKWRPFVNEAPEIIDALLRRRADYEARCQPDLRVAPEMIELSYGEEIAEVARAAGEEFAKVDTTGKGTLSRNEFRQSLMRRTERFSMMEVQMLMQMCKEDDFGQVPHDEFHILLETLRIDALHNALVETDVGSLRVHLILLARRERFLDVVMPVWDLRNLLLIADQLCLARMQIHVILMILHPDENGDVDFEYFLQVCCTVIPYMFDIAAFKEKAEMIAKEKADLQAKQELEELQGITGNLAAKRGRADEEDQEDVQANAPDRDAVEKALIHVGNQADEKHSQHLEVRRFLEVVRNESVQACQLSDAELRGFIAEAEIDSDSQEIAYMDHIKTWVPIIFELRKSRIYDAILAKDWGFDATHLVNLCKYDQEFPIFEAGGAGSDAGSRPSSAASYRRASRSSSRGGSRPGSAARGRVSPGGGRASFKDRKGSKQNLQRQSSRGRVKRMHSHRNVRSASNSSIESVASVKNGGRPFSRSDSRSSSRMH